MNELAWRSSSVDPANNKVAGIFNGNLGRQCLLPGSTQDEGLWIESSNDERADEGYLARYGR